MIVVDVEIHIGIAVERMLNRGRGNLNKKEEPRELVTIFRV